MKNLQSTFFVLPLPSFLLCCKCSRVSAGSITGVAGKGKEERKIGIARVLFIRLVDEDNAGGEKKKEKKIYKKSGWAEQEGRRKRKRKIIKRQEERRGEVSRSVSIHFLLCGANNSISCRRVLVVFLFVFFLHFFEIIRDGGCYCYWFLLLFLLNFSFKLVELFKLLVLNSEEFTYASRKDR